MNRQTTYYIYAIVAFLLIVLWASTGNSPTPAGNVPIVAANKRVPANSKSPPMVQRKQQFSCVDETKLPEAGTKFDGKILYRHAFAYICNHHLSLDTPSKIKAFKREWENKYSASDLNTKFKADQAIRAMFKALNQRFDAYMLPSQVDAVEEMVDPRMTGIGVQVNQTEYEKILSTLSPDSTQEQVKEAFRITETNQLVVVRIIENGPSVGLLKKGDVIIAVDGVSLVGKTMDEIVHRMIRGEAGTSIKITIEGREDSIKIVRGEVKIKVVEEKSLEADIAYIKLNDFMSKYGVDEFHDAVDRASTKDALIIDLRKNLGGNFDYALKICSILMREGNLASLNLREGDGVSRTKYILDEGFLGQFVYTKEGVNAELLKHYPMGIPQAITQDRPFIQKVDDDMPIIVLVDELSASGSELLAGVLKNRATIVGQPTFGKGVGQEQYTLPYGRLMRVTGFEFLPGGESIDWTGVIPHVIVEDNPDKEGDEQLAKAIQVAKSLIAGHASDKALEARLKAERESRFYKKTAR